MKERKHVEEKVLKCGNYKNRYSNLAENESTDLWI